MKTRRKYRTKSLKKQCDDLWIECIKARAGHMSELSGVKGKKAGGSAIIAAHHIVAKPNYRLRYELDNGICLENQNEHIWGVHHKYDPTKSKFYQDAIIEKIGQEKYDWLLTLKNCNTKTDLKAVKIFLSKKLEEYKQLQEELT